MYVHVYVRIYVYTCMYVCIYICIYYRGLREYPDYSVVASDTSGLALKSYIA